MNHVWFFRIFHTLISPFTNYVSVLEAKQKGLSNSLEYQ